MKILVVVDMQNDFVDGVLGTPEAKKIAPLVSEKIKMCRMSGEYLFLFTKDTHYNNYLDTLEGKNLPVKHCIRNTKGHDLYNEKWVNSDTDMVCEKESFGKEDISVYIKALLEINHCSLHDVESIEICGVCTGICVLANAVILKSSFPEIPIKIYKDLCACVTPKTHETAIQALQLIQCEIVGD